MPGFSQVSHSFTTAVFAFGNELVNKTVVSDRIHSFRIDMILMRFVYSSFDPWSRALVGINIAAGIGTSNFKRAAFIVSLNSSSFGSIKNILLNCLALSSFGFSIAHLCFAFFFAASDIHFHISGHTSSGREVVCFLVSLHPDQVYPSGGLSFSRTNLVYPVHASDNSLSPSTFQ